MPGMGRFTRTPSRAPTPTRRPVRHHRLWRGPVSAVQSAEIQGLPLQFGVVFMCLSGRHWLGILYLVNQRRQTKPLPDYERGGI